MVVGFMLIVLGNIINLFEEEEIYINAFTIENISAMLSVVFVSLEKKVFLYFGYGIGILVGIYGINNFLLASSTGVGYMHIGMLCILSMSIVFWIYEIIKALGINKKA